MIEGTTALPVGEKLRATVTPPSGEPISADAWKEWCLRLSPPPVGAVEEEAFLLVGLSKSDVLVGSDLQLERPATRP